MNPEEARAIIVTAVQSTFGLSLAPGEDLLRADTDAWDSLTHVELMFVVEELSGIELAPGVMGGIDSASMLVQALVDATAEPAP
ncbi:MAG TPA: hypothetical protein VKR22_03055 [Acidimicrobiales bacterium]|nr:hypothetical protein [Acidimicrobiales bacterium]